MKIFRHRLLESAAEGSGEGSGGSVANGEEHVEQPSAEQVEAEREARKIGWRPREQFRGNAEDWVDAREFLDRGKTFIPFLNAERHRLQGELGQRDAKIQELQGALQANQEAVKQLTELHEEMAEERKERRKTEVSAELRAAREAGDDVKVAELQNELQTLTKPPEEKPPAAKPPASATAPALLPWAKDWIDGNKEFLQNPRNTALFNAVLLEKRQGGDNRGFKGQDGRIIEGGADLMDEVREEVNAVLHPNTRRQAPSRTEGTRPSSGGGGPRGKSYGDLPPEARAKCDQQEQKFVGPKGSGKLFADQTAWRKHYAAEYFRAERVMPNRE